MLKKITFLLTAFAVASQASATQQFRDIMSNDSAAVEHLQNYNNFYSLSMQDPLRYGSAYGCSTVIGTQFLVGALDKLQQKSSFSLDEADSALRLMYLISLDHFYKNDEQLSKIMRDVIAKIAQSDKRGRITQTFYHEIENMQLNPRHIKHFKQMLYNITPEGIQALEEKVADYCERKGCRI